MEDFINVYGVNNKVIFRVAASENLTLLFVCCGYCNFTSIYNADNFKVVLSDLVFDVMETREVGQEKAKTLECHKCKCKFQIEKNKVKIIKETVLPNNIFLTSEEKENTDKAKILLQDEMKKEILEDINYDIKEAITPNEFILKQSNEEKIKEVERKEREREKNEYEYKQKDEVKNESENKKISFTFVERGEWRKNKRK